MDLNQLKYEVSQKMDEMVMNAFAVCGFSKEFIFKNLGDFYINQNLIAGTSYFYKDKFLFNIGIRMMHSGISSVVYVDFAKEYEELLDKFNAIPNQRRYVMTPYRTLSPKEFGIRYIQTRKYWLRRKKKK